MSIFDRIAQQPQEQQGITPEMMRTEIGRIRENTAAYLQQRGFNIPQGMSDPKQITQYLLQSGQVEVGRLRQVMRMLGR